MNKKTALLASLCLLAMTFAVSAQQIKTENFIGNWKLDVDQSELGVRSNVESMTMTVSKTVLEDETMLTVTKVTKREQREGGSGILGRQGRGRGGSIDGNNVETINYDLSGKETNSIVDRGRTAGKASAKLKTQGDGSLVIVQTSEFDSPRGSVKIKNTETWNLSADGKTLTVSTESETPRGNRNSKMVFTYTMLVVKGDSDTPGYEVKSPGSTPTSSSDRKIPKRISGGVVNGKATSLPKPEYPADAIAANAKGTVQVKIIISNSGKVISAEAISGHPLLRQASVDAAKEAKFTQTTLEGHAVEVEGIIIYIYQ